MFDCSKLHLHIKKLIHTNKILSSELKYCLSLVNCKHGTDLRKLVFITIVIIIKINMISQCWNFFRACPALDAQKVNISEP